jgi:hypothetical protein
MTASEIVAELKRHGWSDEAIFRLPAPVMADWFRERGHDDVADRLAGTTDFIAARVRDHVWMNTSVDTQIKLWPYILDVKGAMDDAMRDVERRKLTQKQRQT